MKRETGSTLHNADSKKHLVQLGIGETAKKLKCATARSSCPRADGGAALQRTQSWCTRHIRAPEDTKSSHSYAELLLIGFLLVSQIRLLLSICRHMWRNKFNLDCAGWMPRSIACCLNALMSQNHVKSHQIHIKPYEIIIFYIAFYIWCSQILIF